MEASQGLLAPLGAGAFFLKKDDVYSQLIEKQRPGQHIEFLFFPCKCITLWHPSPPKTIGNGSK